MKQTVLSAIFFLAFHTLSAQALIPWLGANGKYGYADEKGKVLIQPKFDTGPVMTSDSLGVEVSINRQLYFLLRNGLLLRGKNGSAKQVLNYQDTKNLQADTLSHLWQAQVGGKAWFVNHLTGDTSEFWANQFYGSPEWFFPYYRKEDKDMAFQFGLCRVYKKNNKVNFLDTNLKEVFPRDFEAGLAVSSKYVLLGNEKQKMGLGDSKGNIRIPFVWKKLQPTEKEGFFIANNADLPLKYAKLEHAGMIDADGKIVIDTVYRDLEAVGKNYLIVRKKFSAGVMDYSGKWIIPMDYREITHVRDDFFIAEILHGKVNVINTKGDQQFPTGYNAIIIQEDYKDGQRFLELWDYPVVTMSDADFHIMFSDTNAQSTLVHFLGSDKKQFMNRRGAPGKPNGLHGVRDITGKFIIPAEYDRIGLPTDNVDLYLVGKDERYGMFDTEGHVILPLQFASIRVDEADRGKKLEMIWARPEGSNMFSAYDLKGNKLPYPDNFMPSLDRDVLVDRIYQRKEDKEYLVFIDGSRMVPDKDYEYYLMQQFRTPEGGFLINFENELRVWSAFLKNILPTGFTLEEGLFDAGRLKQTGLLTVYQTEQSYAGQESFKLSNYPNEMPTYPKGITASGVINARGEWVVAPKNDTYFLPMSHHWVLEMNEAGNIIKLHRVNTSKNEVFDASMPPCNIFSDWNHNNMLLQVHTTENNVRVAHAAYFDHAGEQMTDFKIIEGPGFLQHRNLVALQNAKDDASDYVIDEKGKVVFGLGPDLRAMSVNNPDSWDGNFVVAADHSGLCGVLDSTKKTVLPFRYSALKILENGRLLRCNNKKGNTDLLNWQGETIYSYQENAQIACMKTRDGYLLVASQDSTIVISPENEILRIIPQKVEAVGNLPESRHLAISFDGALKKPYLIDIISGLSFRE